MRFSLNPFALSALSALLISPSLHAEELEPPNVSIYADVMLSMAQTKRLTYHSDDGKGVYHHGETDGYRARVRLRFDDMRSEEHTSELQSRFDLVCRLLLEKKKKTYINLFI